MKIYDVWRHGRAALIAALGLLTAAGAAAAADTLSFIEGAPPTIAMTDLYVAEDAGFFKDEGLDLEINFAPNGAVGTQMVASNQGDIGDLTMEAYLSGHGKGMRGKYFASRGPHNSYFIVVPADSDIRDFKDLEGKKIGVLSMGSQAIFYFKSMARMNGIDPNADMFVPVGFGNSAVTALKSGKVQALGLVSVAISSVITSPDEFRYIFHPTVSDAGNWGYFASDETLAAKRDEIVRFTRALIKSDIFIRENPEVAIRMYWKRHPEAKPSGDEEAALKLSVMRLNFDPYGQGAGKAPARFSPLDGKALEKLIDVLQTEGLFDGDITLSDLADLTIYTDAMKGVDAEAVRQRARTWEEK